MNDDLTCPECEGRLELPEENGDTACIECGARVNVHGYNTDAEEPEETPEPESRHTPQVAESKRTIAQDLPGARVVRLSDDSGGVW